MLPNGSRFLVLLSMPMGEDSLGEIPWGDPLGGFLGGSPREIPWGVLRGVRWI
jgi:hypothetical protein